MLNRAGEAARRVPLLDKPAKPRETQPHFQIRLSSPFCRSIPSVTIKRIVPVLSPVGPLLHDCPEQPIFERLFGDSLQLEQPVEFR